MVGQTMSARNEILKNVRQAIGEPSGAPPITRHYIQQAPLDLDQFISRLEDYNAGVFRCQTAAIPETIAAAMEQRGKSSLVIPLALPPEWLPPATDFVPDRNLSYEQLDASEGALTACTVAIAFTGTIILTHSDYEGRRALTLIPDYHLCIVREDQVVQTVPEGIRKLRDFRTRPITTISGPSATADIEMTRIKGVHGPRTLDVILVRGPLELT
jgi:L-lactate dehydrogenase complex protein LldG